MNIKQTVTRILVGSFIAIGVLFTPALPVLAQGTDQGCETKTAIIKCENRGSGTGVESTGLWSVLILVLNVLTGLVAVAALGGIIWGSILYTSAGGSTEQTKKGITVITNVVIGIVAYGLMYVGLNFLIPGGVFN